MISPNRRHVQSESGVTTLESGMLVPILVLLMLGLVQLIIYLQSATATQYAAFVAGRAYQVYGERTLGSIGNKRVREHPYTNKHQTIAEAAAEKVIFESLLWEHRNIVVDGTFNSMDRYYKDGADLSLDGARLERTEGAVRANLMTGLGAEITYCMPIVFPGVDVLFAAAKKEWPCKKDRNGEDYTGVAITRKVQFGREPVEK